MSDLQDLMRVLYTPTPKSGVVVTTYGDMVTVSTSSGPKVIQNTGNYKQGDTLLLRGDTVLGKVASIDSLPIYYV